MNEKIISERTRKILKDRGFFIIKFNDNSRSGIPDMAISKNGKTIWVEDKFISVQIGLANNTTKLEVIRLSAKSFISKDRIVQMVTMCKLQRNAFRSEYWLYIECCDKYYITIIEPQTVFESYRDDRLIKLMVMDVNEFRSKFEI